MLEMRPFELILRKGSSVNSMIKKSIELGYSFYDEDVEIDVDEPDIDFIVVETVEEAARLIKEKMNELGDRFCEGSVIVHAEMPDGSWDEISEPFVTNYWWEEDGSLSREYERAKNMIERIADQGYVP